MQKLVQGIHQFRDHIFSSQRELFERLAKGQSPETLFITCSDSRINPNLLTQTGPGDLFILRNAGNIIPPYGFNPGGEIATIEYAVTALGVRDIIVCGHSHCGAMSALHGDTAPLAREMPAVANWLQHAEATKRIVRDNYAHLSGEALVQATVEENVLVQIENLRTHPAVAAKLTRAELTLHGWVYHIQTGEVFAYSPEQEDFVPVEEHRPDDVKARTRSGRTKARAI